eukprot:1832907-Heterocapsa_arctica.AAC.1
MPWDFNIQEKRDKACRKVLELLEEQPILLIGSPGCHPFSKLQQLTWHKRPPEEYEAMVMEGLEHH